MPASGRFMLPDDHPALPGHFPGRPIVPGVLLLDAVLQAIARQDVAPPSRLVRAKFSAPVAPGDAVEITLEQRSTGGTVFTCHCRGIVVLSGAFA